MEMMLYYLNFPFVQYAFIVGILVSICTALMGTQLVFKKRAFFGSSLSNVAFALFATATAFQISHNFFFTLCGTLIVGCITFKWLQAPGHNDAKLAMLSVGALSMGYLMVNSIGNTKNAAVDVCQSLFGSVAILTLSKADFYSMMVVAILVIGLYIGQYHNLLSFSLDLDFMVASGRSIVGIQWLVIVMTVVVIVLGMQLVGALLVSATVVFPVMTSQKICRSHKGVVIGATLFSVLASSAGIFLAILLSAPVGPTIVMTYILIYAGVSLIHIFRRQLAISMVFSMMFLMTACASAADVSPSNAGLDQGHIEALDRSIEDAMGEEEKDVLEVKKNEKEKTDLREAPLVKAAESNTTKEGVKEPKTDPQDKSKEGPVEKQSKREDAPEKVELDLSIMNPNMAYATLSQMFLSPVGYSGKRVKMKGLYYPYEDPETGKYYHIMTIDDTAACCSQAIIFEVDETLNMQLKDYPDQGTPLTIEGSTQSYEAPGAPKTLIKVVDARLYN